MEGTHLSSEMEGARVLDRENIERKDFPVVKRGYDPAAVDARLSAVADEVDELKRGSQHPPAETVAGAVSEQVRGIVEAAEESAEAILRRAELEAEESGAQASRAKERAIGEAQRVRAKAREYVERLSRSISALVGRLETIDSELNALTASMRRDTEWLRSELTALEDELEDAMTATEVSGAAPEVGVSEPVGGAADVSEPMPAPVAAPQPAASAEVGEAAADATEAAVEGAAVSEPGAAVGEPGAEHSSQWAKISDEPVAELPTAAAEAGAGDAEQPRASAAPAPTNTEGARLMALNMALNGTPREETERYLAEKYGLADRQRLLDEVYASVLG
jgi:DivIVA domain-containing protein